MNKLRQLSKMASADLCFFYRSTSAVLLTLCFSYGLQAQNIIDKQAQGAAEADSTSHTASEPVSSQKEKSGIYVVSGTLISNASLISGAKLTYIQKSEGKKYAKKSRQKKSKSPKVQKTAPKDKKEIKFTARVTGTGSKELTAGKDHFLLCTVPARTVAKFIKLSGSYFFQAQLLIRLDHNLNNEGLKFKASGYFYNESIRPPPSATA